MAEPTQVWVGGGKHRTTRGLQLYILYINIEVQTEICHSLGFLIQSIKSSISAENRDLRTFVSHKTKIYLSWRPLKFRVCACPSGFWWTEISAPCKANNKSLSWRGNCLQGRTSFDGATVCLSLTQGSFRKDKQIKSERGKREGGKKKQTSNVVVMKQ